MKAIRPLHASQRRQNASSPAGMVGAKVPHALQSEIEAAALAIFVDMSNAGFSFQEALAAVFVSGLNSGALTQAASAMAAEKTQPPAP